ncbi:MAG: TonB-dependent receptor [Woeseia sp.]|nr:TonB-dependent receptor [Gammaproteobacteria bacterium]NNE61985.1 TonB-dependent receptor [Woeseia sp.]
MKCLSSRALALFPFAAALASVSTMAPRAEAQDAGSRALDEITVTARRREERLQDVPISVSLFGGEELDRVGTVDIVEVAKKSPNVTLEVSRGTNSTLSAFIRGAGQQDPVAGYESGVGLYLDDVYFNRPHAAVLELYDVERIEVLRGPQGTLYGRNTIGGAIRYITRALADEPYLKVRGSVGSYNQLDGVVIASTPLTDSFRIGGAVARYSRDGYGDNLTLGTEHYDKDVLGFRGTVEWDATEALFFRLAGDVTEDQSSPKFGHRLQVGGASGAPILADVFDTRGALNLPDQDVDSQGVSLLAQWAANDAWTFKAIVADRSDSTLSPIDFDSLPVADLDVPVNYDNEQFSAELQAIYSSDRLNGVMGYYYLDANAFNVFDVVLDQLGGLLGLPGFNANTFGDVDTDTWSVFADFAYDLNDAWNISLGGRYTKDERSARVLRRTFVCPAADAGCGGFSPTFGGNAELFAVTSDFMGRDEWSEFTPRVSVNYAMSDSHNFYLTYSEGFKGGGFDPRGQSTAATDIDGNGTVSEEEIFEFMNFRPESVESFELGWKSTTLDGRLYSAIAAFVMDYTDYQVPGSLGIDTDGDGLQDTFAGSTSNAGSADIFGLEFEGSFRANDYVSLSWALGFFDGDFKDFFVNDADFTNVAVIQNTPERSADLSATFEWPVAMFGNGGTFFVIPSINYQSEVSQFEIPSPLLDQGSYTLFDLSLVWEDDDDHWRVGLHGKNLTDEEYIVAGYDFPGLGLEGNVTGFYGPPQTVTLTAEYSF